MINKRLEYLDIIRVVACLMVIVMHAPISGDGAMTHGPFLVFTSYLTAPCVPLFFMVSGALLLPCREGITARAYLAKRIGKIVGPTVCFSLFYIVLNIRQMEIGGGKTILLNLLSIPFSAQGHGILWFMYTLMGLYLLVPILSPWIRRASKHEIELYLVLWFVTLLYPYIGLLLQCNTGNTGVLYCFSGYVGYFLLGHYLSRNMLPLKVLLPVSLFVLPLPLFNKLLGWGLDFYTAFWYLSAPVAILTASWFCCIKRFFSTVGMRLSSLTKALTVVSNLSFGIYLVHIFVMRTLLWNWSFIYSIKNYYLQTFIIIVLTFMGSFVIVYLLSRLPLSQYIIGYTVRRKE